MQLEWDGKVGPASIVSLVGALAVLVSIGIVWGTATTRLDATAIKAEEAKAAAVKVAEDSGKRDQRVAAQAERLGKIETSVGFIVPALQRIESKLDAKQGQP